MENAALLGRYHVVKENLKTVIFITRICELIKQKLNCLNSHKAGAEKG